MNHYGYIKTACASFPLALANVKENCTQLLNTLNQISENTRMVVFPELCLTGSTCNDLFWQQSLLKACLDGLKSILEANTSDALLFIGLPFMHQNKLYDCVAVVLKSQIIAMIPKTSVSTDQQRWFVCADKDINEVIDVCDQKVPFIANVIFHDTFSQADIACVIGEALYDAKMVNAHIIAHPCNSIEIIDAAKKRRNFMTSMTLQNNCALVSCSSDMSESTTDLLFSGEKRIVECGLIIQEANFLSSASIIYGEVDLDIITSKKLHNQTNTESSPIINISLKPYAFDRLTRKVSPYPFVPNELSERIERCKHILAIQAAGLAMRMKKIYCQKLVIGISGGLDSTLALIVCIKAMELLQLDPSNIITITMPGFGTSKRTKGNSHKLMEALGTTVKEISIHDACLQHFKDIEHDPAALDITYENTQARERTQILMDYANKLNALVVGTGDLSELALGWCTYNGDHMSMYAVNGSIPKTLIRHLVNAFGQEMREAGNQAVADTLEDICATPVSPELLPPKEDGNIAQETEKTIGSYDYHDFFLYYMLKYGMSPTKIYFLAKQAFVNTPAQTLKDTMKMFYRRFFTQQFKRSCMPDGVKAGSISLSPRGDLRMPSDASYQVWMQEVEAL